MLRTLTAGGGNVLIAACLLRLRRCLAGGGSTAVRLRRRAVGSLGSGDAGNEAVSWQTALNLGSHRRPQLGAGGGVKLTTHAGLRRRFYIGQLLCRQTQLTQCRPGRLCPRVRESDQEHTQPHERPAAKPQAAAKRRRCSDWAAD